MKSLQFFVTFIILFSSSAFAKEKDIINESGFSLIVLNYGEGFTFANQVTNANTIYEIRHPFDLNNKTVVIPENCVLRFLGGSLKNGTIVGNNTFLEGNAENVLEETLYFHNIDRFHIEGISFPKGKDISICAQRMLDVFNILKLHTGTYYLSSPLVVKNHYARIKGEGKGTILTTSRRLDYAIRTAFKGEVNNTESRYYNVSFIEVSDIKIDGTGERYFKNGIVLDGPSCIVNNCYITRVKNVGVKLCEWCNSLFNCIITHCDIGAFITQRANGVNVCYNRIESNKVNLVLYGYRGVNICNNTLEGGEIFNMVIGYGQSCKIKDNYFEGYANSITNMLTTTEGMSLIFNNRRELRSMIWVGNINLKEQDGITMIYYKIGSPNAPSSVDIQSNYVDIHRIDNTAQTAPDMYFALIGSCLDRCVVKNNILANSQSAVCGFFDTDNAILGNAEILNNFVAGTAKKNNSLEFIYDQFSKSGCRAKNHIVGELRLDNNE